MKANTELAVVFINQCLGPYNNRFRSALVLGRDLQSSQHGKIRFRVPKFLFPKSGTQHEVLKRLTKTLGQPTETYMEQLRHVYRWDFSEARCLTLTWLYQDGTYINLIDTEAA